MAEKYNASNIALEQILNFIKSGEIAIPEIQRPFPNIRLKDGTLAEGKKIMIDGQQRVTALMTAIMGMDIIDADFQKKKH